MAEKPSCRVPPMVRGRVYPPRVGRGPLACLPDLPHVVRSVVPMSVRYPATPEAKWATADATASCC